MTPPERDRDRGAEAGARAGVAAERAGTAARGIMRRAMRAFGHLEAAQRLAVYASLAMFATLFLPWYSETFLGKIGSGRAERLDAVTRGVSGWAAFSFVEAAVLLVAAGIMLLLFRRGEGRAFHLPGGDGTVIAAAGGWAALLIFYRLLDQPSNEKLQEGVKTYGLRWGIFFALGSALFLASTGVRLRAARLIEPPLPGDAHPERRHVPPDRGEDPTRVDSSLQPTRVQPAERPRARATGGAPVVDGGTQLSFDESDE